MTKEVMATMAWFHWLPVLCLVVTGAAFLGVMEAAFAPTATRHLRVLRATPPGDETVRRAWDALRQHYLGRWYAREPVLEAAVGRLLSHPGCLTALSSTWEKEMLDPDDEDGWDQRLSPASLRETLLASPSCLETIQDPGRRDLPWMTLHARFKGFLLCLLLLQMVALSVVWFAADPVTPNRGFMTWMLGLGTGLTAFWLFLLGNGVGWNNFPGFGWAWVPLLLLYHGFGWSHALPFWMQTTLALLATVGGMLSVAAFLWASAF